jgi:hypothetical protein
MVFVRKYEGRGMKDEFEKRDSWRQGKASGLLELGMSG